MQAHVTSVLKGVVKESSKGALSELLGSRAAATALSNKVSGGKWEATLGIVLIDDARLRAYTPRAAVEWALKYETANGEIEETCGGTWFSQKKGGGMIEAESYIARTAAAGAGGPGPWTRAPVDQHVRMTANETRAMLKIKADGWASPDFNAAKAALKENCLAEDAVTASPFEVHVGPKAIIKGLGKYRLSYEPAEILLSDVVVGVGGDCGLFAAQRAVACAAKGSDNFDSDRELVFGEIVLDEDNVPKLRYARSIFNPETSPRSPDPLPDTYPVASTFSNYTA